MLHGLPLSSTLWRTMWKIVKYIYALQPPTHQPTPPSLCQWFFLVSYYGQKILQKKHWSAAHVMRHWPFMVECGCGDSGLLGRSMCTHFQVDLGSIKRKLRMVGHSPGFINVFIFWFLGTGTLLVYAMFYKCDPWAHGLGFWWLINDWWKQYQLIQIADHRSKGPFFTYCHLNLSFINGMV